MSNQIPLALIITELEVGGAERCLANLAIGLDSRQFAPIVYALASRPAKSQDALVRQIEEHGIPIHFLHANHSFQLKKAVRQLRRHWRDKPPAVAQTFLFHANVVAALAVGKCGTPVLSLGYRVADPARCRQQVERWAAKRAERVVCVSDCVAQFAQSRVQVPAAKLEVIPNGIDVKQLETTEPADLSVWGVPRGAKVIICVARLTRQKGIDRLLRAAPHILRQLPKHHILLVGDGPERARMHRLAERLEVSARVHFCGWQPNIPQILRASQMLVLPSRWEGMPNVLLEAMACGLPVVSTRADGVQQALGPLSELQTVADGTPQAIAEKVVMIASDDRLGAQLGVQNQQRVGVEFALSKMVARYEQLFHTLAAPARSG